MIQLSLALSLILTVSSIMLLINLVISKKSLQDREKKSPFECGFDPLSKNHIPFSIHFFLISLIFLIFDIEITLLLPMVYLFKYFNTFMIKTLLFIMLILLSGLYMEYTDESLEWKM